MDTISNILRLIDFTEHAPGCAVNLGALDNSGQPFDRGKGPCDCGLEETISELLSTREVQHEA